MFTPLLAHSNSSASGTVNFRFYKYAKAPVAQGHGQAADAAGPTWGSSIAGWIKGIVEETPVTGDEMDELCMCIAVFFWEGVG